MVWPHDVTRGMIMSVKHTGQSMFDPLVALGAPPAAPAAPAIIVVVAVGGVVVPPAAGPGLRWCGGWCALTDALA